SISRACAAAPRRSQSHGSSGSSAAYRAAISMASGTRFCCASSLTATSAISRSLGERETARSAARTASSSRSGRAPRRSASPAEGEGVLGGGPHASLIKRAEGAVRGFQDVEITLSQAAAEAGRSGPQRILVIVVAGEIAGEEGERERGVRADGFIRVRDAL